MPKYVTNFKIENETVYVRDPSIRDELANETAARQDADTTLSAEIAEEERNRTSADTALQNAVNVEVLARQAADSQLNSTFTNGIANERNARIEADSELGTRITQLQSSVGTPLVASTVAGMTDHNKIYVYVGSEQGYTNGNWYYWNGSAWTSGGVYNSTAFQTDTTLSISGKAADAKVVGDKFNRIPVQAVWNGKKGGIYIQGDSIKTNRYGFGVVIKDATYYIAPVDNETEYTFTPDNTESTYNLVIDLDELVAPNARNEPSDVLSVVAYGGQTLQADKLVVATYFKGYWEFVNEFSYFNEGADKIQAIWNNRHGGVFIDGMSIKTNANGFGIVLNNRTYFIAPTDMETEYSFTAPQALNAYNLVIDRSQLTNENGRNDPSDVLSVVGYGGDSINANYIKVATFYRKEWKFINEFEYFNEPAEPMHVMWNGTKGGIYIDGQSIKTNANGFGVVIKGSSYYIAPVDHETEYTFTPANTGSTYNLVLDMAKLTNVEARNEPNEVLSVVGYGGETIWPNLVVVATFYKGYWEFVNDFAYFNQFGANKNKLKFPTSGLFAENQLIAHQGGDAGESNTISNFESAIQNGYKMLETDVQFTSDDVAVLCHEDYITVGGQNYNIADNTYAELVALKPNLATLEQFIKLCKRNNVVGELDFTKQSYTTTQQNYVVNMIKEYGVKGRVMITCYPSITNKFPETSSKLR